MKRVTCAVFLGLLAGALAFCLPSRAEIVRLPAGTDLEVLFTPGDAVTPRVVEAINAARRQILVQAYSFTSRPIAQALIAAHRRGVEVAVIVDASQRKARGGQAEALAEAGVPVFVDRAHAIAHNKVMILDASSVLTGSFNWTAAAERSNAENLLLLPSRAAARAYAERWHDHRNHSEAW